MRDKCICFQNTSHVLSETKITWVYINIFNDLPNSLPAKINIKTSSTVENIRNLDLLYSITVLLLTQCRKITWLMIWLDTNMILHEVLISVCVMWHSNVSKCWGVFLFGFILMMNICISSKYAYLLNPGYSLNFQWLCPRCCLLRFFFLFLKTHTHTQEKGKKKGRKQKVLKVLLVSIIFL